MVRSKISQSQMATNAVSFPNLGFYIEIQLGKCAHLKCSYRTEGKELNRKVGFRVIKQGEWGNWGSLPTLIISVSSHG